MSLSQLALSVWVFLFSAQTLGWISVKGHTIAIVGIVYVALVVLEAASVISWRLPIQKRP